MSAFRFLTTIVAGSIALTAIALAPGPPAARAGGGPIVVADQPAAPSLYKRLGGYDAIAALTDDFIGRLAADKRLSKFFTGLNDTSKARVRQHVVDLLCQSTGGPCIYLGQDMKTAHKGLNITEADWNAAVEDLTASFDKFNVGQQERSELVAKLATLKPDIVQGGQGK
jgi:hemoglobin